MLQADCPGPLAAGCPLRLDKWKRRSLWFVHIRCQHGEAQFFHITITIAITITKMPCLACFGWYLIVSPFWETNPNMFDNTLHISQPKSLSSRDRRRTPLTLWVPGLLRSLPPALSLLCLSQTGTVNVRPKRIWRLSKSMQPSLSEPTLEMMSILLGKCFLSWR